MQWREVAESVGLRYRWGPRSRHPLTALDSFGAGCAFLDFDGDGRLDVLAVGEPGIRLFLQRPPGFEDVSGPFGLQQFRGHWTGIAVGDYDGDGWPDLLITGFRGLLLLRNLGGRALRDMTTATALSPANWSRWGSSAGFADLDGDGDLDLVVMNYLLFGPSARQYCELAAGVKTGCPPREYDPEYTRVYRNDQGRFVDVTVPAGCNTTHGKGLALAFCDYDHDGKVDLFLGNDGTPSDLLHNLGGFHFKNVGVETGAAFGVSGQPSSAMGADWGDFDRDGKFDLVCSAFSDEEYTLLRQAHSFFQPITDQVGMGLETYKPLGFGTKFLDADNDGRLDIHFANGHVYDNVQLIDPSSQYAQPMMLFRQNERGTVEDLAAAAGPGFAAPMVGRGSAAGDYDNDGRLDLLVVDLEGRLRLYHNQTGSGNHWITLDLRAGGKNSQAYGARVELRQASGHQLGQVAPASSYLSSSDPRVHFGLGQDPKIASIRIEWPFGMAEEVTGLQADRIWRWQEGGKPTPERETPALPTR